MIGLGFGNFQSGGGGFDPDTSAFITAAGITGETQQTAINQLVLDLKGTGSTTNNTNVWSDLLAVYPMCPIDESTATRDAYKWNLKDPRDLDAAFRITWVNNPTASVNGIVGNGTNQYGNTHFNASTQIGDIQNVSFGFVSNTNVSSGDAVLGASDSTNWVYAFLRNTSTNSFSIGNVRAFTGITNSSGIFITSSNASNEVKIYQNNVLKNTYTNSNNLPNLDNYLLAYNNSGSPAAYSQKQINCAFFGNSLTTNQITDLNNAITTYNTALSR